MKQAKKTAPLKSTKDLPVILDIEKENEYLKTRLEAYKKRCNKIKKRASETYEYQNELNKKLSREITKLYQTNTHLQFIKKSAKFWQESYSQQVDIVKTNVENYLVILKESDNLFPLDFKNSIGYHEAQLNKLITSLSSLVKKSNLLGSHAVTEFLSNQN